MPRIFRRSPAAVPVQPDADVIDAHQLQRMQKMGHDVVDRALGGDTALDREPFGI